MNKGCQTLPSRTFYNEGESLFSYLLRTAYNNGISILLLMNMIRKNEKYLLHKGDIRRIDYYPESVFDLKKLTQLAGISQSDIHKSTFANVLNAFGYSANGEKARLMQNMIRETLYFCSQCLKEGYGYNLMWKIEGIHHCHKHNQKLLNLCSHCHQEIGYDQIVALYHCPLCNYLLIDSYNNCKEEEIGNIVYQQSLQTNLIQLIEKRGCFEVQSLAQKLLFIMNSSQPIYDADVVKKSIHGYSLTHLLQYARNTIVAHKNIRLLFILKILHDNNMDINSLHNMELPSSFVESLLEGNSIQWTRGFTCVAPWCKEKGQPNSLTSTSSKHARKAGEKLSHYLVCKECFCEYAFNKERTLVERTSFIAAYDVINRCDLSSMTWPEKIKCFSMNRERIRRASAYFNVRLMGSRAGQTQNQIDCSLLQKFVSALREGKQLADIRYWSIWDGYEQYLMHRYHPVVMRELFYQRYGSIS
ncbi:TniQ family protein [Paenibacillus taichungensis]|uniref:TniQ family protein n=1 Tax=Paenibacillus taichungensis TaxID=484184 RepID=UPI002DB68B50|nr:TniQ family protein [Paenibacillus taichungensis]MEC0105360.1 TniQ family protein [Paenibacillus taichungensis]MEC0200435.1 TniQ family protein [Paenibacillus taichungensis]